MKARREEPNGRPAGEVGLPRTIAAVELPRQTLQGAKRFQALAAVLTVMFFSSMAATVVSTALPNIVSDLHGFSLYAWVFTAYTLGAAVVIPVYGKLSDVYGRKPMFVIAIVLFLLGNVLAGFAKNMELLVAARAVAGLGGGGLQGLSQITIGDIFTPKERGRWMGVMMAAFGLSSIIGPTIGGWITDGPGWRWVFWFNVPIGLIPLVALLYTLPSVKPMGQVRIDYLGIVTMVGGLVPILFAITWLGENYALGSGRILVCLTIGIVLLCAFVWQEFRIEEPIISPSFFKSPVFLVCMLASFAVALGMYGSIMFIPLFVQGVVGTSAQDSGVVLAPMMVGFMVGSMISGQLMSRWGRYRILSLVGLCFACVGLFLLGRMDVHSSNLTVVRNMVILGIGIGSTMPLYSIAVQNAFPHKVLGAVTASRTFFVSLGGAVGVPIMGAMLNNGFAANFTRQLSPQLASLMNHAQTSKLDPNTLISAEAQSAIHTRFAAIGPQGPHLYAQFIFAVRNALATTMQPLFHLALGFMLAALVVTLFLKEIPLRGAHVEKAYPPADEAAALAGAPEPLEARVEGEIEPSR